MGTGKSFLLQLKVYIYLLIGNSYCINTMEHHHLSLAVEKSEEKFAAFEKWLLENGSKFPKLVLQVRD